MCTNNHTVHAHLHLQSQWKVLSDPRCYFLCRFGLKTYFLLYIPPTYIFPSVTLIGKTHSLITSNNRTAGFFCLQKIFEIMRRLYHNSPASPWINITVMPHEINQKKKRLWWGHSKLNIECYRNNKGIKQISPSVIRVCAVVQWLLSVYESPQVQRGSLQEDNNTHFLEKRTNRL